MVEKKKIAIVKMKILMKHYYVYYLIAQKY